MSKVIGTKIYDPRIDDFVVSDNPALILGDIAKMAVDQKRIIGLKIDDTFWEVIKGLADHCDREV